MESIAPFEIDELRRDWIAGVSGDEFYRRVMAIRASLEGRTAEYIIREEDPIAFAEKFFAAVSMRVPTVLVSPMWRFREEEQFAQLISDGQLNPGSILIPTGGTTGGVKLAIHDWASLRAASLATEAFLGGGPVHSCCVLPLHHVSGLMQLLRAFVSGGTISFDADDTAGRCLSLVPTQLKRLMQTAEGIQKMNTARVIFVGGAAMPKGVERQARDLKLPVVPVYGMTETAAMVAAIPNEDFIASSETGAIPLGDAQVNIDPDGSIRIRSSSLFKGYYGGAPIDMSEGYRTGDAGWLDAAGRLHLIGRMDALINTGGEKVDPVEVREALLLLEGIGGAHVVGEPDAEWGEAVIAYVWPASSAELPEDDAILASLKKQLSPFKMPKQIRRVDGPQYTGDSRR